MRVEYKWRTRKIASYSKSTWFQHEIGPWQCGKITEKNFDWQTVEVIKYVIVDGVEFLTPVREFKSYGECLQWLNDEWEIHSNSNVGELIYG